MFLSANKSVVEVEPGFELVANIVVSPDRGNFFTVLQVKIVVGLPTIAKCFGKVGREKGKTKSAANGNDQKVVGYEKFARVKGDHYIFIYHHDFFFEPTTK